MPAALATPAARNHHITAKANRFIPLPLLANGLTDRRILLRCSPLTSYNAWLACPKPWVFADNRHRQHTALPRRPLKIRHSQLACPRQRSSPSCARPNPCRNQSRPCPPDRRPGGLELVEPRSAPHPTTRIRSLRTPRLGRKPDSSPHGAGSSATYSPPGSSKKSASICRNRVQKRGQVLRYPTFFFTGSTGCD